MEKDNKEFEKEIEERVHKKNPKLMKQSFSLLDGKITPETIEVISRQATINIGTIGHVAHGKTTLVKSISGVNTNKHATEKKTTKTINLGYANAKIYKCDVCPDKSAYKSFGSGKEDEFKCETCKEGTCKLQRHVSFVDCPGHDLLMATMLNGAAIMDSALLLVAANESCPQPQTAEHLIAVEKMNLQNIIIVQNKVDMIIRESSEVRAKEQYDQIKKFVKSTNAHNAPIIPISAQFKYNIDVLLEEMCKIPVPNRNLEAPPKFIVVRSFDNNRPGTLVNDIVGGSAGGTLIRGILKVNDEIEVRPGLIEGRGDNIKCRPYITKITTIRCEENELLFAIPGGLIALGTLLDPSLTGKDRLVGNIIGLKGHLPDVFIKISAKVNLLTKLLGSRNSGTVDEPHVDETLTLNVGSTKIAAVIISIDRSIMNFSLLSPVCAEIGEKFAISRLINNQLRLIGWGEVLKGTSIINN